MIVPAVISITLALVFYTIGVWWERKDGTLRIIHVVFFVMGLICDAVGTSLMSVIARSSGSTTGNLMSAHGITGVIAIILMFLHAVWAIIVLKRNKDDELSAFHRFSIVVWVIWLVPYILGMVMGMR